MGEDSREDYVTVDDFIKMLQENSRSGNGKCVLLCNDEYMLAKKGDKGTVNKELGTVSFGGYDLLNENELRPRRSVPRVNKRRTRQ